MSSYPEIFTPPHELIHSEIMELSLHSVTGSQDERRWPSHGFDHVLEKKPWARVRRSVSYYGRFMPHMFLSAKNCQYQCLSFYY